MRALKLLILLFFIWCLNPIFLKAKTSYYTIKDLSELFLKEAKKELSWVRGKIYLEDFRMEPEELQVPRSCRVVLKFIAPPRIGSNVALARFYCMGKSVTTARLWGYVEAKVKVVVVKREVPNRAILRAEDLGFEERKLSKLPRGVIFELSEAVGRETKMSLRPGRPLLKSQIKVPPLIRRRQVVTIIARGKHLIVKAKGIALQDGNLNQRIKVKNISSKKIIWGKVISPEEVEVMF